MPRRLGRGRRPRTGPGAWCPTPPRSRCPTELRPRSRRSWRATPTATRRRCPRWPPRSGCTAGARRWRSRQVAAVMQVTPAYLSSVATFYDMLRTEPVGSRYVYVCTSVACHLRNAKARVRRDRRGGARPGASRTSRCASSSASGACDMAPMASVDGRYVGPLDRGDAHELVAALKEGREVLPGGARGRDYSCPGMALEEPEPERPHREHRRARPAHDRGLRAPAAATAPRARR